MDFLWEQLGHSWWFYAQSALTIAMLIHVYRSGAEFYWVWIILFLPGIGAWVYFFAVCVKAVAAFEAFTYFRVESCWVIHVASTKKVLCVAVGASPFDPCLNIAAHVLSCDYY